MMKEEESIERQESQTECFFDFLPEFSSQARAEHVHRHLANQRCRIGEDLRPDGLCVGLGNRSGIKEIQGVHRKLGQTDDRFPLAQALDGILRSLLEQENTDKPDRSAALPAYLPLVQQDIAPGRKRMHPVFSTIIMPYQGLVVTERHPRLLDPAAAGRFAGLPTGGDYHAVTVLHQQPPMDGQPALLDGSGIDDVHDAAHRGGKPPAPQQIIRDFYPIMTGLSGADPDPDRFPVERSRVVPEHRFDMLGELLPSAVRYDRHRDARGFGVLLQPHGFAEFPDKRCRFVQAGETIRFGPGQPEFIERVLERFVYQESQGRR